MAEPRRTTTTLPNYNVTRDAFRFQLTAGAHLWPQLPMQSLAEAYYQLSTCLGQLQSAEGLSVGPPYRSTNFHIGLDLEKMAATAAGTRAFSGLNTKASNDQLRFQFDTVTSDVGNGYLPARQYVFCQYNTLLELRAEGAIVAD